MILRAGVETAYYQVLLDEALIGINAENIANLKQVVHVTQVQYTASQATQADSHRRRVRLWLRLSCSSANTKPTAKHRVGLNQLLYPETCLPIKP